MSTDYAYRTGLCRPLFYVDQNCINLYLWYISNEGLEFRVQCMICFILMQKAILLYVN